MPGPTSRLLRALLADNDGPASQAYVSAAMAEGSPPLPLLFPAKLNILRVLLPLEKIAEMIALHIVDTALQMTDIASRRAAGDLDGVADIAELIAANANSLGALRASGLARQLEAACRKGEAAGTYRLISELSQAHCQAGEAMRAWLDEQISVCWID